MVLAIYNVIGPRIGGKTAIPHPASFSVGIISKEPGLNLGMCPANLSVSEQAHFT